MITLLSSISLHFEYDLVAARRRARHIAALLGFPAQDQTRVATVAAEIARAALRYGGGRVEFAVDRNSNASSLVMIVTDRGAGERDVEDARRLMDDLQVTTKPGEGTTVTMRKTLTSSAPDLTNEGLRRLADELLRQRVDSPLEEIQQQNAELLRALADLERLHATQPLRILIIDDDETARYTLANFASRPGAEIFEAENGLLGIARAAAEHPDVILLDLMMPGIGGHEVLARLKSDPATANIPVLIITTRFVNDDERRQILTRAATVIYKGDLSRETVSRAIARALPRQ